MNQSSTHYYGLGIIALFQITLVAHASAASVIPLSWSTDCVGRLQISLPNVDSVATITPRGLRSSESTSQPSPFFFADGQRASFSSTHYFGLLGITGLLSDSEISAMRYQLEKERTQVNMVIQSYKAGGPRVAPKALPIAPFANGAAWDVGDAMRLLLLVGNQYLSWDVAIIPAQRLEMENAFNAILMGIAPRRNFTIPAAKGVCFPNSFIADDGKRDRQVGTTYRLAAHPDITVWLEDANASAPTNFQSAEKITAIYKTNFFWTQRYQSTKGIENLLTQSHNKISFAGQLGVESQIRLLREDDTEDFGYLVATQGNPGAKVDTPDVMMYVIRDAKNARSRGIEPFSRDAFFELATTIASSVKHRNVVAGK